MSAGYVRPSKSNVPLAAARLPPMGGKLSNSSSPDGHLQSRRPSPAPEQKEQIPSNSSCLVAEPPKSPPSAADQNDIEEQNETVRPLSTHSG